VSVDLEKMLQTVKDKQWSLADIDWDAPGAEQITDEQRPGLTAFMADLVWIENVGARGFASLAKKAPDETTREIFRYFHAEEQKHANAELALMKRWGMLDGDRVPEPNTQVRMAISVLDRFGDDMPFTALAALIPMLECALDGALVKFLLEEVRDPLCHEVFRHINSDEARHITVDFEVLDRVGAGSLRRLLTDSATMLRPTMVLGLLVVLVPLLNKMRDNIVAMGLVEKRLYNAIKRYASNGDRGEHTWRVPAYHVFKAQGAMMIDRRHPYHRVLADPMVALTDLVPRRILGGRPTWSEQLTHEPVAR
jgi:hypothetical protein